MFTAQLPSVMKPLWPELRMTQSLGALGPAPPHLESADGGMLRAQPIQGRGSKGAERIQSLLRSKTLMKPLDTYRLLAMNTPEIIADEVAWAALLKQKLLLEMGVFSFHHWMHSTQLGTQHTHSTQSLGKRRLDRCVNRWTD